MISHEWVPTTVGHGVMQCKFCKITMLEAAAIGRANHCEVAEELKMEGDERADNGRNTGGK